MDAYNTLLARASGVANTPYTPYTGELVAPVNQQQYTGINNINQNANFALPNIQNSINQVNAAGMPLTQATIGQYQNPANAATVGATEAQFDLMNKNALNNIQGNAAMSNALGGDRTGVAKAAYYGAVAPSQNQTIANLESQNYWNAAGLAQQQQQNAINAGVVSGGLAESGQQGALTGANAQIGAGSLEQTTEQARLNALYQQYQIAQAFPYQQTQWLAGLDTGVGSQMGGTSSTTAPAPNPLNSMLGFGLAGLGVAGNLGWQPFAKRGGGVPGLATGGTPYGGAEGWIPGVQIAPGRGAPPPPKAYEDPGFKMPQFGGSGGHSQGIAGISTGPTGSGLPLEGSPDANSLNYVVPMANEGFGIGGVRTGGGIPEIKGGGIPGFADGGSPTSLDTPEARQAFRESLLQGKKDFDSTLPGSNIVTTPEFIANAIKLKGFADGGSPSFNDMWAADQGLGSPYPSSYAPTDIRNGDPAWGLRPYMDETGQRFDGPFVNARVNESTVGLGQPVSSPAPGTDVLSGAGVGSRGVPASGLASLNPEATGAYTPPQNPAHAPLAYGPGYDRSGLGTNPAPSSGPTAPTGDGYRVPQPVWTGLMAAGLGMMASRSPFLGQAIGEGGLQGLGAYNQQVQQQFSREMQQEQKALDERKVNIAADRLAQEAQQFQQTLKLNTQKEAFTENQPVTVPLGGTLVNRGTGQPIYQAPSSVMSPEATDILARRLASGDATALSGLPQGTQGAMVRSQIQNRAAQILTEEQGRSPQDAAAFVTAQSQAVHAAGIGQGAGARTEATREANLNMILATTDAAIPAALEASRNVSRTGWVPINQIIQKGEVIASNPDLKAFGMANLQLAEGWARAMNPTGVMRESDRDKALSFLSTADSPETYERAVNQLRTQITRERDAVRSQKVVIPGGAAPSEAASTAGIAGPKEGDRQQFKQGWGVFRNGQWVPETP